MQESSSSAGSPPHLISQGEHGSHRQLRAECSSECLASNLQIPDVDDGRCDKVPVVPHSQRGFKAGPTGTDTLPFSFQVSFSRNFNFFGCEKLSVYAATSGSECILPNMGQFFSHLLRTKGMRSMEPTQLTAELLIAQTLRHPFGAAEYGLRVDLKTLGLLGRGVSGNWASIEAPYRWVVLLP